MISKNKEEISSVTLPITLIIRLLVHGKKEKGKQRYDEEDTG